MMGRTFRIKLHLRRFARRHPWIAFTFRSLMVFSVVFGGAYGFIAGSRAENSGYNPHTFAIGVAFLFAIACVALAATSFRLRMMRRKLRKIALHNEVMADRNWELQEAEQRARLPVRIAGRSDRAARRRRLHQLRQRRLLRAGAIAAQCADRQPRLAYGS